MFSNDLESPNVSLVVVGDIPKVGGGVPNLKVRAKLLCKFLPIPSDRSPPEFHHLNSLVFYLMLFLLSWKSICQIPAVDLLLIIYSVYAYLLNLASEEEVTLFALYAFSFSFLCSQSSFLLSL